MRKAAHILITIAAVALLSIGITAVVRHDRAMHAALRQLQADNQADTVFTSDSAALSLVSYFDHPWHSANDRLLAHYLLGRAHADMGEAPQAIEDYQTAIERADTTAADCDFRLLRNVYGQMAEVFDAQNLPEDELKADSNFIRLSWLIGDTIQAIDGIRCLECPYYLLSNYDKVLFVDSLANELFISIGEPAYAAKALLATTFILCEQGNFEKAKAYITMICQEANIFDEHHHLILGQEMFYYTLGSYYDGTGQLDSAEYYYRRALSAGELEAGYKGLLSVYSKRGIADSITKFAPLYCDANDAMHRNMNSAEVHKTASLYNYNRHLREKHHYKLLSTRRLVWVLSILCLLLLSLLLLYLHHRHAQKIIHEKETRLLRLHLQYATVNDALRQLQQRAAAQEHNLSAFQEQLAELTQQKAWLERLIIANDDRYKVFHEHELVKKFISAAIPLNKVYFSAYEREQLISLFQSCFPSFTKAVQNLQLKDREWIVIILTELGFQTGDMQDAARLSSESVTYIKRALSKKLFHQEGLSSFHIHLKTAIITGRLDF